MQVGGGEDEVGDKGRGARAEGVRVGVGREDWVVQREARNSLLRLQSNALAKV